MVFYCDGMELCGILHHGKCSANRAVVLLVGGAQYRVGSHRQFLLLARYLAQHGVPVLRFDYRGMGDSEGGALQPDDFGDVQADIKVAVDAVCSELPDVDEVVLWGLCGAATANAMYGGGDGRIAGLVLVNPWVRDRRGVAKAYLKHYYAKRLMKMAFWRKLLAGRLDIRMSMKSLTGMLLEVTKGRGVKSRGQVEVSRVQDSVVSLSDRMLAGLNAFQGEVLFITSGNDLTAKEFLDVANASRSWKSAMKKRTVQMKTLAEADHTFSMHVWREQVEAWTLDWLESW